MYKEYSAHSFCLSTILFISSFTKYGLLSLPLHAAHYSSHSQVNKLQWAIIIYRLFSDFTVKSVVDVISQYIIDLANLFFSSGLFTTSLEIERVMPLIKRPGLHESTRQLTSATHQRYWRN